MADRSARRSSSGVRSRRSASSSSVFRLASGVRSSWLASATNPRSRSSAASSRASIAFSVSPSRRISSSAGGIGSCSPGRSSLTSGRLAAHRLDRPKRGGRDRVAGERREQQRDRQPDAEQQPQRRQRLLVVVDGLADHERETADGHGEEARRVALLDRVVAGERQRSLARPADLVRGQQRPRARAARCRRRPGPPSSRIWVKLSSLSMNRSSPPGTGAGPIARSAAAMSVARERRARSVLSFRLSSKRV